eukprot:SAG25_NODE_15_length_24441_cov_175.207288_11_plen_85_part_00
MRNLVLQRFGRGAALCYGLRILNRSTRATTDGGMWVGLVSDLAPRSHSRRIAHRLVGGEVALSFKQGGRTPESKPRIFLSHPPP